MSINQNSIFLDNKNKIFGKKIFICAGLIGTINLLRSIKPNIDFTFKDHSSSIDLVYSKKINQKTSFKSIYSMICKIYFKDKIKLYAKFYPFKSLEILFYLGKLKFFLPKFLLNYKLNFKNLYFVQKWHNTSVSEYILDNNSIKKKTKYSQKFVKLDNVYKNLEFIKLFTFKPNFYNFHFHDLNIIENSKKFSVNNFLKKNNPNVSCPGLLSERNINCLPPSFESFVKTSSLLKKN